MLVFCCLHAECSGDDEPRTSADTHAAGAPPPDSVLVGRSATLPRGYSLKTLRRQLKKQTAAAHTLRAKAHAQDPASTREWLETTQPELVRQIQEEAVAERRKRDGQALQKAEQDFTSEAAQHMTAVLEAGGVSFKTHQRLVTANKGAIGSFDYNYGGLLFVCLFGSLI